MFLRFLFLGFLRIPPGSHRLGQDLDSFNLRLGGIGEHVNLDADQQITGPSLPRDTTLLYPEGLATAGPGRHR